MRRFIAAAILFAALSGCGRNASALLRRLPESDREMFLTLDVFMTEGQKELYLNAPDADARSAFLEETGYVQKWEDVEDEIKPLIARREVQAGMSRDEVYMAWDKPFRIQQTFMEEAYVDTFIYRFERDARTGQEFVSPPDSTSAYRNEVFERWVHMHNGAVARIDIPADLDPASVTVVDGTRDEDDLGGLNDAELPPPEELVVESEDVAPETPDDEAPTPGE